MPADVTVRGVRYRRVHVVKHDSYAATGFYDDDAGRRIVVKIGRTEPALGLPTQWLGQWLCDREVYFYRRLRHVPGVPAMLGRIGPTGFAHAYVPGRPLEQSERVDAAFFAALKALLEEVHAAGIAYVDLNKPQNILLGDDGKPHLIDFQISWDGPLRAVAQRDDWYHYAKHMRRLRPDLMTDVEHAMLNRASIRWHRRLTKPYFALRRPLMRWMTRSGRMMADGE